MFKFGKIEIMSFAMYFLAAGFGVFFGQFFHSWAMVGAISDQKTAIQKLQMEKDIVFKDYTSCTEMHRVYQILIQELLKKSEECENKCREL